MSIQRRGFLGALFGSSFLGFRLRANAETANTTFDSPSWAIDPANSFMASPSAANVPLVIRSSPSQTANMTEWQDSTGRVLCYINANGRFHQCG
jgi:hypothetical protein